MTDLVLIDSSLWVPYLRRKPDPTLVQQIREWLDAGRAATAAVIQVELLQAVRTEGEFERLQGTLEALCQLPCETTTWRRAARNGFMLRRAGVVVPTTDLLIATIAQQGGAALAHRDRHYEMIGPHLGFRTVSFL